MQFIHMRLASAPKSDFIEYDTYFAKDFNAWENVKVTLVYIVYSIVHVTVM